VSEWDESAAHVDLILNRPAAVHPRRAEPCRATILSYYENRLVYCTRKGQHKPHRGNDKNRKGEVEVRTW
jgi:hypothetical protein